MAKETKNITISREEYDFLKKTSGIYKSIVGLLMANIQSDDETEYKYSHKKVEEGYYCDEPTAVIRQILAFVHYFDPTAYAVITGRAIEITSETLHKLVEELSAEAEEEEDEDDEVEAEA